jgi:hypothetical protein
MRALAFRAEKAAAAAAIVSNLVSCAGAHEKPAPPVVINIPAAPGTPAPLVEDAGTRRTTPQKKATSLSYSQYGPLVEARLSVIAPDDSLERIILDPQVTFYYLRQPAGGGSPGTWATIPGCKAVPECVIPEPLTKGDVEVRMEYVPGRGVAFSPARLEFTLEKGSFVPLP